MTSKTIFKDRWEREEEEHMRHRKHREDTVKRRIAKLELEGFKCTFDGCKDVFENSVDLALHIKKHNEECYNKMICNQSNCGKKFKDRKKFNKHIEEHKEEAIKKIKKNLRSVLIVNQKGILLEEFDREFKSTVGKPVPYKLLGCSDYMDLAEKFNDVIQVVNVDGVTFLQGVPDDSTLEFANDVQNQMSRTDGFNFKTGKVLGALSGYALSKLSGNVEQVRKTPEYIKKHIFQLIEFGEITEEGISFDDFQQLYDQEFGHSFPLKELGYNGMDDLFLNGLEGIVDLKLEGYEWKIIPCGTRQKKEPNSSNKETWDSLRVNMRKLLKRYPYGLSIHDLRDNYIVDYGDINFRQLKCKDMLELCLLLPDVCQLDHHMDITVLPAGSNVRHPFKKPLFPLYKLGRVKSRVETLLDGVDEAVALGDFVRAYNGYYGYFQPVELMCDSFQDVLGLMPEVCTLKKVKSTFFLKKSGGNTTAKPQKCSNSTPQTVSSHPQTKDIPEDLMINLRRVLSECPDGVYHSNLYRKYLELIGESLNVGKYGFSNITSLMRSIHGCNGFRFEGGTLMCDEKIVFLQKINPKDVPSGWVKVVNHDKDGNCKVIPRVNSQVVMKLDQELEEFYMTTKSGRKLAKEDCVIGQSVAVLYTDTRFYRGTVIGLYEGDVAKVYFVDQGCTALIKTSSLFWLDKKFWHIPEQVVEIKLSSNQTPENPDQVNGGFGWLENTEGNARVLQSVEEMAKYVTFSSSCVKRSYKMDQVLKSIVLKKILLQMC